MDSASVTGSVVPSTASSSFSTWTGPGLEQWDLIVVGTDVAGLNSALEAADFHGRVGIVGQRSAASSASLASSNRTSAPPESSPFQLINLPGWAVFTGPHTIAIHGREVAFHRAILATGARWDATDVAGLTETGFDTPEILNAIQQPPRQVAVLGNGAQACEAAQALRRLGSDVQLVTEATRLLEGEEPLAALAIARALEADGVKLHLGFRATSAELAGRAKAVLIEREAIRKKLLVDEIVLAGQRRANLERMGIEAAGVHVSSHDGRPVVEVDSRLATSNARIFAVGGIAAQESGNESLERMCQVAVQNAVGPARHRFDAWLTPRIVSTLPQVARIGATAATAQARRLDVESWFISLAPSQAEPVRIDAAQLATGAAVDTSSGFALVHTLREMTGRIAGATLVGPHAAEAIGLVGLLMAEELPLSALSRQVTPLETFARALSQLAETIDRSIRAVR